MAASYTTLQGKTALVTGAARRLGRAMALALAREGVNLALHYNRSHTACEATADEARALGVPVCLIKGDFHAPEASTHLIGEALAASGRLDILINNASTFEESRFDDVSPETVHADIDVNALAPFMLARAFAAKTSGGCIINLLDTMIADYDRKHVAYHLSKRMLHALTRILAVELAPAFRVNAVAPGLILPPEGKGMAYLKSLEGSNLLQTHGDETTISETMLFLLRNEFMTGQVVFVDGGRSLRGSMYGG